MRQRRREKSIRKREEAELYFSYSDHSVVCQHYINSFKVRHIHRAGNVAAYRRNSKPGKLWRIFQLVPTVYLNFLPWILYQPERIEWFMEGQAFLRSYDSSPRHPYSPPPLSSASCISFSVFLCVAGPEYGRERGKEGMGVESSHTTARKPGPL